MLSFQDFPAHVRLMLLCARAQTSVDDARQVAELTRRPGIDWAEFLSVTTHHRLAPLVFETLSRMDCAGMPAEVQEQLQAQARANAFEAMRSTAEVQRIMDLYAAAEIPLSVMKGVPLSQYLFGNPNARHVGDIDLLTEPKDLPRQLELLGEAGYRLINPRSRLTPHRMASYVTFWKDFTFQNRGSGFDLDLHWRLFNNRFHAANPILADASYTSIDVFGVPMRVFCPGDQFIYIAAHGISDAWTYLKSLADVAAFLNRFTAQELDAALVRARELGLLAQISAAVHLANDWMGASASSTLLLPASEQMTRRIWERTERSLLRHNFRPHRDHTSPARWLALELKLVPGVRSVVEVIRRFVWRPRVWQSIDLPDGLFWIYPVLGLFLLPRQHSQEDQGTPP